jgi:hypothetical protein
VRTFEPHLDEPKRAPTRIVTQPLSWKNQRRELAA